MDLPCGDWVKSSHSDKNTNCVELSHRDGRVAIRDSRHPDKAVLPFDRAAWAAFLGHLKRDT